MTTNNQLIPVRAAFYLRVSTDEQIEKYGLDLQQAAIEGVLKSKGQLDNGKPAMVLAGKQYIYKDEGVSGTISLDERPGFLQMKEDIENAPDGAKPFDIVVVYRIDRFARRLRILFDVIDYFEKRDIQFISANESIDTSTPFGKAMLGIIGVIAELETETTKARTQAGRAQAREKGVYMGANAPFGYTKNKSKQLIVLEQEAITAREIFELFVVHKKKTQQIADYLIKKRILTPLPSAIHYGKRKEGKTKVSDPYFWRDNSVRDIIKDEIYTGRYFYAKEVKGKPLKKSEWQLSPYRHEPIIDIATFELAQRRILEDTASRNSLKAADNHLYLLSGLLKCHACYDPYADREPLNWTGTSKVVKRNNKRAYYYQCGAKNSKKYSTVCRAIPFPADEIEQFVTDFIANLLSDPTSVYSHINALKSTKARKKYLEKQQKDFIELLNGLPDRRAALRYQHEEGHINTTEFESRITRTNKREEELNKDLAGIEHQLASGAISDIYMRTFELFSKQYQSFLDNAVKDRRELFDLIHLVVDKIQVYSRQTTESDRIAGRKKENQVIPYRVRIDLRLPQDMLLRLSQEGKFDVKNRQLWARKDSNLQPNEYKSLALPLRHWPHFLSKFYHTSRGEPV